MTMPTVGIDAGATLCKVATLHEDAIHTCPFPSADLDSARRYIELQRPARIIATGGGATRFEDPLSGLGVETIPEFAAWSHGVSVLASRNQLELPERYLLVSLGTGTSILLIAPDEVRRVGGTALGGGTLLGLGRLLIEAQSFEELTQLAQKGDRRSVDLLVGDIYKTRETPLPRDLNAASFAKQTSAKPEDIAHALVGMIGENVALICTHIAALHAASTVIYCGSTLHENPALEQILQGVTDGSNCRAHFLEQGAYCGAIGAASWKQP